MNQNTRARGEQNGEPGVWPKEVEAKPVPIFIRGFALMLLRIFIVFYRPSWSHR